MPRRDLPTCLFCGMIINPPEEKQTDFGEICFGKCPCGAIYVCEPTGHNQGEALVDAMILADSEGIENIELGVNYDLRDKAYDFKTHQYIHLENQIFCGRLFFIKPMAEIARGSTRGNMKISKRDFIRLVEEKNFEQIEKVSLNNPIVFGWLISLSYDKENSISWKAIQAMGHVAKAYVEAGEFESLRNTIRKLLWSMTEESGGVGWRAAELIGEIIYASPAKFKDIIPILWSKREEDSFLESVLRSMIKLSNKVNLFDYIKIEETELKDLLNHRNDEIKALTAILIYRTNIKIPVSENIEDTYLSVYINGEVLKVKMAEAEKYL